MDLERKVLDCTIGFIITLGLAVPLSSNSKLELTFNFDWEANSDVLVLSPVRRDSVRHGKSWAFQSTGSLKAVPLFPDEQAARGLFEPANALRQIDFGEVSILPSLQIAIEEVPPIESEAALDEAAKPMAPEGLIVE